MILADYVWEMIILSLWYILYIDITQGSLLSLFVLPPHSAVIFLASHRLGEPADIFKARHPPPLKILAILEIKWKGESLANVRIAISAPEHDIDARGIEAKLRGVALVQANSSWTSNYTFVRPCRSSERYWWILRNPVRTSSPSSFDEPRNPSAHSICPNWHSSNFRRCPINPSRASSANSHHHPSRGRFIQQTTRKVRMCLIYRYLQHSYVPYILIFAPS